MLVQRHKFVQPNFTTPNKVTKPNQKPKLSEYTPTDPLTTKPIQGINNKLSLLLFPTFLPFLCTMCTCSNTQAYPHNIFL